MPPEQQLERSDGRSFHCRAQRAVHVILHWVFCFFKVRADLLLVVTVSRAASNRRARLRDSRMLMHGVDHQEQIRSTRSAAAVLIRRRGACTAPHRLIIPSSSLLPHQLKIDCQWDKLHNSPCLPATKRLMGLVDASQAPALSARRYGRQVRRKIAHGILAASGCACDSSPCHRPRGRGKSPCSKSSAVSRGTRQTLPGYGQ